METWAIVTLVLGTSALSSLLTFFITKMQVRHSDRRFEKELERAREADDHQRRWEVESDPLLKLKAELARMASKLDKLAVSAHQLHTRFNKTEEQAKEELEEALNDWNNYISSDDLRQVLSIQHDVEIVNLVKKIRNEYLESYEDGAIYRKELTAKELGEAARAPDEKIGPEVIKVQSLINKRLKEL